MNMNTVEAHTIKAQVVADVVAKQQHSINPNSVEAHTIKARVVMDVANKANATANAPVANLTAEELAVLNNPMGVEGHLQKWRGSVN